MYVGSFSDGVFVIDLLTNIIIEVIPIALFPLANNGDIFSQIIAINAGDIEYRKAPFYKYIQ
ncbi:hypothetical protein bthur0004_60270 [Bacillus thuringiensis serovar sotto str. T04001]|nr:hypothetical protein bthur0004_60270 [Bacillus thuringiensis serovar sotto str. T04001]